jgi:hypothetical protein
MIALLERAPSVVIMTLVAIQAPQSHDHEPEWGFGYWGATQPIPSGPVATDGAR